MAVLIKKQILEKIKKKEITFSPALDKFQLQDHAVDLRLGFTFMIPKTWNLTAKGREAIDIHSIRNSAAVGFEVVELEEGQYFDLLPQENILVSTLETLKISNDLMSILYPRSSINRKGLSLDLTGIIDSGYQGQLILPIENKTKSQTIRLYPGERFCQIIFEELTEEIQPKQSRYHMKDIIDGVAKEKKEELNLVIKGDIKNLKEKFSIL